MKEQTYTIEEICKLVNQVQTITDQRDSAYDAIRKIAVTSHSTSEAVRWNAIEDAQRILPENQ